ncbi:hypothetical protein Hypma_014529 [Hypsizygus marmoreus]|uniref:Uncharacterized protein n=1 Tax=Hypsizygus marmoreus TaxID=39966 RepID=A0A369JGK0_HYPMA|nr:hypothetical protein Hypma_014529 [Hypsizygus marmoreus]
MNASAFVYPHALVDGVVYTVLQGSHTRFPAIPSKIFPESESTRLPDFTLKWIPNEFPFLFFIPKYKPFYGPLFNRLAIDEKHLPIECVEDGHYSLDRDVITDWVTLERNLRAILSAMHHRCGSLPPLFQFWAFPKRYGYENCYRSQRVARAIAIRSRDAFVPLMAALSFFYLVLVDREVKVEGFAWRDEVLRDTGIHYEWLAALEHSVVADMTIPRVGGIVDMKTCQYSGFLKVINQARMDFLCLCWGPTSDWGPVESGPVHADPYIVSKRLMPDHIMIDNLSAMATRHSSRSLRTAPLRSAPLHTAPLRSAPLHTAPPHSAPLRTSPQPFSTGQSPDHTHRHCPPADKSPAPAP